MADLNRKHGAIPLRGGAMAVREIGVCSSDTKSIPSFGLTIADTGRDAENRTLDSIYFRRR
jgi:hypothetical protein